MMFQRTKTMQLKWVKSPITENIGKNTTCQVKETAVPTPRDVRHMRRTKLIEEQARITKKMDEMKNGFVETHKEDLLPDVSFAQIAHDYKTLSGNQPDLHHRDLLESPPKNLPFSLESGLNPEPKNCTDYPLHQKRTSNNTILNRNKETRIKFPASNDKIWNSINKELETIIPKVFSKRAFKRYSTSELSTKFDQLLHNYFTGKFETDSNITPSPSNRPKRLNKRLEYLRQRKNKCKAAHKALLKAGLKGSPEEQMIKSQWRALLREHNQFRKHLQNKQAQKQRFLQENNFKKNPQAFSQKLFHENTKHRQPNFTADEAKEYFTHTYHDISRDHCYSSLDEFSRPGLPQILLSTRSPTKKELEKSIRRKRNSAAPGFNALTYVPFKKCPCIQDFVFQLSKKIWNTQDVPSDWAQAYITLISKSDNVSNVSEFRPIAVTSTAGKIFFSVISMRLQMFMIKNSFISRSVQKGFLTGVSGCLEHAFALMEALREAKTLQRQIVVTWIDLANAYGSVRHNLIQFALNWYHVPKIVQQLIFDYYEKLVAKVITKNWSTEFFTFDIGLFQGCVLSTILFDCVFQLLLDFLKPIDEMGYRFKSDPEILCFAKAYADDLTVVTRRSSTNQLALQRIDTWLNWSATMAAKPQKCISLGFKMFSKTCKHEEFIPKNDTLFSAFDPCVYISGQKTQYIVKEGETDPFKRTHFKFLGRWINENLSENQIKWKIKSSLTDDLIRVHNAKINGFMKAWIYQFYVLSRLSWVFLVHDLDQTFANNLSKISTSYLKKWLSLFKSTETGVLYRSRENFGLGLTSVLEHFQRMQIIKCELLNHSVDDSIQKLYHLRETANSKLTRTWKATNIAKVANAEVDLNLQFPTQVNQCGLGFGHFNPNPDKEQRRSLVIKKVKSFAEETRIAHSASLQQQGAWLNWHELVQPFDLSWRNVIWGNVSPHVIRFVLLSSVNWLPCPALLKLWSVSDTAQCCLCNAAKCTMHHILSNCPFALQNHRYSWRHDSVLSHITPVLDQHLKNNKEVPSKSTDIVFVKAGQKNAHHSKKASKNILSSASDWKLLVDSLAENIIFPPEIYCTPERPDIVIWSSKSKNVILIELTCPAEEGIQAAANRKTCKYQGLIDHIHSETNWKASLYTIEVGVRGFVAKSTFRCLAALGLPGQKISKLCRDLSITAAKCSYAIFLCSKSAAWEESRELLGPDCIVLNS
jgi:Reverse transcriptase (RNA-dependent DNA polymerase)